MGSLVDTSSPRRGARLWAQRAVVGLAMFGVVGLVAWAGLSLSHRPTGPARQVARIALLPDTPPPPPPPPPPEKPKIEPKNEIKQQIDKPKMERPPEPEQLKMEGQAGQGPSPFAAGKVNNDYIGGDIGNGARFAAYVGRIAQLIQDDLARRNLRVQSAKLYLWLTSDGTIQRYQISGASGDVERVIRTAMGQIGRVPEAPPQDMPMPMGLEITER
jgi:periplasmic protein TonB